VSSSGNRRVVDVRHVALARVQFRRDGEVPRLGEAAADVLDVFVDAKDFLNH